VSPERRIFVIRHGETPSNAARVFQTPDTRLSERGSAQALALASRLRDQAIVRVLSSDYERAVQTASAVAQASGAQHDHEPLLRERHFGELRGRAYADVAGDPFREGYAPPGGESWDQFNERADKAWDAVVRAAADSEGNLAVVTHGLVCRAFLARRLSATTAMLDSAPDGRSFQNTSVTIVEAEAPWRVERLCCTEHLVTTDTTVTTPADGAPA
jgi:probable phosphoglycerate mutase